MKIYTKLVGLVVISLSLLGIISITASVISLKEREKEGIKSTRVLLMKEKKNMLSNLVDSLISTVVTIESDKDAGIFIQNTRYGQNNEGYFWINDMGTPFPKMVMHPIAPQLNGKILDNPKYNCAMGKDQNLFQAMVEVCSGAKGQGLVPYLWAKPGNDKKKLFPKLSFVKKIEGRNWIIGTGIYIDDIDAVINGIKKETSLKLQKQITILAVLILSLLAASIILSTIVVRRIIQPITKISDDMKDLAMGSGDLTKRISLKAINCSEIKKCGKKECSSYGIDSHCWINSGSFAENIECKKILSGEYKSCVECSDVYQKSVGDEITTLSSYFNAFLNRFQQIFATLLDGINTLNISATELHTLSDNMKGMSNKTLEKTTTTASDVENMNKDANAVSVAMDESLSNINLVSVATEEMTSTVKNIAGSSEKAHSITEKAVSQTQTASGKIGELGQAARDIGAVTEAINEISEQTNLLALNATIEAARAGEAGKGFAVVANEIKELAKQTAEATTKIKEKINGIQNSTDGTIAEIEQISEVIFEVNEIVSGIAGAVDEQSATTNEIANNVNQSATGLQGVNDHLMEMSSISGNIENNIVDINVNTGTMVNSIEQVFEKAESLASLATKLKKLIGTYKV